MILVRKRGYLRRKGFLRLFISFLSSRSDYTNFLKSNKPLNKLFARLFKLFVNEKRFATNYLNCFLGLNIQKKLEKRLLKLLLY